MVESLRYTKELPDNDYWTYTVTRQKCHEVRFKNQVHEFSFYGGNLEYVIITFKPADDEEKKQEKIDNAKKNWKHLVVMNVSKANYICNGKIEVARESESQKNVFSGQLSKYVNTKECKVAILNAFPIFLFDYFGVKILDDI